jgi:ABC-2 type transport system ATP-binding protein
MAKECAVETIGLVKSYRRQRVLDGIELRVALGSVFVLLGPNGAGKTTVVRILSTLVRADAGRAVVAGFDVVRQRHRVRRAISLTGQYAALDELQTGTENLRMMARLAGLRGPAVAARAAELVERFDLGDAAGRRVGTYSGGMRRRLDLAASLVSQASIIFLDEPTTGLDPRSRLRMWQFVEEIVANGATVFLTTQYLDEADRLADQIAVLDAGRVVASGSAAQLKQRYAEQRLDLTVRDETTFDALTRRLADRTVHSDRTRRTVGLATDGSAAHVRELLDEADPTRRAVTNFSLHTATLDDVFLTLTGHATGAERATEMPKETVHV